MAPSRFFLARQALLQLVARLEGDRFALVAFEGEAYPLVPLTLDADALGLFLETVEPGIVPAPGTSLGVGLAKGLEAFVDKERRNKVMVLVSDGEDLEGEVEAAVRRAKEAGVVVHAVGVGTEGGQPVPERGRRGARDRLQARRERRRRRLAARTSRRSRRSRAARAGRPSGSRPRTRACPRLAAAIEGMEQKALAREYSYRRKERFQVPLAFGLACLALGAPAAAAPAAVAAARAAVGRGRRAPGGGPAAGLGAGLARARAGARRPLRPAAAPAPAAAEPARRSGAVLDEVLLRPRRATEEGRGEYARGNHPQALSAFERAAEARPQDPAVRFNVADGLYKNGKYDEAAALFRALGADPASPLAAASRYNLGNSLYQKQDYRGRDPGLPRRAARGARATRTRAATSSWRCARSRSRRSSRSSSRSRTRRTSSRRRTSRARTSSSRRTRRDSRTRRARTSSSRQQHAGPAAPADAAGARRPALPAGGGDAARAGDAAARRPAAEREGGAEEAPGPEARAEEEGEGLVSARRDVRARGAPSRRFSWRSRRRRHRPRSPCAPRWTRARSASRTRSSSRSPSRAAARPTRSRCPALTNLEVVAGPSQSTQVSIVNGRMSQSRSITYVLQPRAVGKAEVGAVRAGDQTAPGDPDRGRRGQRPPARSRSGRTRSAWTPSATRSRRCSAGGAARGPAPKLLVEAAPSRTRLRVGEPLVLTYSLYTQTSVTDLQFKDAPQFAGFWVEDLERPQASPSGEAATVGGESYRRFPILRKLLFPTKAGTLTLPAATFRIGLARQGFFDTGGVGRARDEAAHGHRRAAAGRARLLGGGGPLPRVGQPRPRRRAARRGGDAALPRRGHRQPQVDRPRARGRGDGREGLPAAGEERPAHDGRGHLRLAHVGVRGGARDERHGRGAGALRSPTSTRGRADRDRRDDAARAAGRGRDGGGRPARAGRRRRRRAAPCRCAPSSTCTPPAPSRSPAGRWLSLAGLALLLHAGLWGAGRLRGGARAAARRAPPRRARCAPPCATSSARARRRRARSRRPALVEKALHEAFGEIPDEDESERARAVRALLDDARFVRYAPQLGDYSDKVEDLAARAAEAVRRWA